MGLFAQITPAIWDPLVLGMWTLLSSRHGGEVPHHRRAFGSASGDGQRVLLTPAFT